MYDDDRFAQDNARVLHAILAPFRWLMNLIQAFVFAALFIGTVAYLWLGFFFGWGDLSLPVAADFSKTLDHHRNYYIEVDFSKAPRRDGNYADRIWLDAQQYVAYTEPGETIAPGAPQWAVDQYRAELAPNRENKLFKQFSSEEGFGIPFCEVPSHIYGNNLRTARETLEFMAKGDKDKHASDRKATRMRRDYATAAFMVSGLRAFLTNMKLHLPASTLKGPQDTEIQNSYCAADGPINDGDWTGDPAIYRRVNQSIKINHGPVMRFKYLDVSTGAGYSAWTSAFQGMIITGMTRGSDYASPLVFESSGWHDLFDENPPLTPQATEAEQELLKTTTEEFWERAAFDNGIFDTAAIRQAREKVLQDTKKLLDAPYARN